MGSFLHNKISPRIRNYLLLFLISLVCGLAWYMFFYGRYPLYFSNVDWTYAAGGDVLKAQIGWEWFRQEGWHFPLGRIESYGFPAGTSLSFLDSIPLMAIPLKLLSPLLDQNFQYLGVWEMISLIGQLLFGMLILGEFTTSYPKRVLGASLLVLSPPLIYRAFFHGSLSAHWILLAAIWFIVLEYRHKLWRWSWVVLFAVAMLVHLYFVAMLLPLWAVSMFFRYKREKFKWWAAVDFLSVLGVILLLGFCLGLFGLGFDNLKDNGFGYYSWNINGLINPMGKSAILNSIPINPDGGQSEGFSYLGLGNLLILPIALIFFLQKEYSRRFLANMMPFAVISAFLILFALSNRVFLNDQLILTLPLPEKIENFFSMFRSSGRFIWPVFYCVVLFGLITVTRNIRFTTPLLVLALILQVIDLQPLYSAKKAVDFGDYQSTLKSEFWHQAAKVNQHILLLPATETPDSLNPIIIYARQNDLTLNWGYFSRVDNAALAAFADQAWEDLKTNRADDQTIYVFWDETWLGSEQALMSDSMVICEVDDFTVAITQENGVVDSSLSLEPYCSFP